MITPNAHIAAMAPYALADLSPPPGKRLISLAQNESTIPPSPLAMAAGRAAFASAALYPDPDWTELRQAIGDVHNITPDQLLCGAGSMELIACLTRCYAGPERLVLSTGYGYAFFRTAAQSVDAPFDTAAEQARTVSVNNLLQAVQPETVLVFVANPGNPTGTRIGRDELVRLRDGLRDDILLVIDEAYGEFADAPGQSTFDLVDRGNTVVLRTFSKAYGLAGLRAGWGLFPKTVAGELRKLLNPNNISIATQAAATAAMGDQKYMRAACAEIAGRRDGFIASVRKLGLDVDDSYTNFALLRFQDAEAAGRADMVLRAEGVFMRGMAGYGLAECLRATIGSAADMDTARFILSNWSRLEGLTC